MKKILTLEIYKCSADPLNENRYIVLKLFNRWKLVTWVYNREYGVIK